MMILPMTTVTDRWEGGEEELGVGEKRKYHVLLRNFLLLLFVPLCNKRILSSCSCSEESNLVLFRFRIWTTVLSFSDMKISNIRVSCLNRWENLSCVVRVRKVRDRSHIVRRNRRNVLPFDRKIHVRTRWVPSKKVTHTHSRYDINFIGRKKKKRK